MNWAIKASSGIAGLVLMVALVVGGIRPAEAAWPVTCTNCSKVFHQIMEYATQLKELAQLENTLRENVKRTQMMETNLLKNKNGVRVDDILRVTRDIARVMQMGKDIASTAQRASQSFDKDVLAPDGSVFSEKYLNLTNSGQAALKNSLLQAGLQREQFADDQSALEALVQSASSAKGNLAALNALSSIGAHQIKESMQLRSLIAEHQSSMATYLATQTEKERQAAIDLSRLFGDGKQPMPKRGENIGGI